MFTKKVCLYFVSLCNLSFCIFALPGFKSWHPFKKYICSSRFQELAPLLLFQVSKVGLSNFVVFCDGCTAHNNTNPPWVLSILLLL
uniref:Uncharacterized protein n=1 Tax=Aegilops tauschii subsp. strangulata TaxID=200361 RepID=A0A453A4S7_AEGTS